MSRLTLVALFAGRSFKRQKCSATTLLRATSVFFVGHEELQGSQQEGPEAAFFPVSPIEIAPFQDPDEEFLRKILRVIGRIPAPAQIGIQRIPVALTQGNEGGPGFLAMGIGGSDDEGPPRRRKLG